MLDVRKFSALVGVAVLVGLTSVQAGSRWTQYQVTTTIADIGGGDFGLRIQSDRKGAYVTKVVNRVTQVSSLIDQNMNGSTWSLTTYYNTKSGYVASDRTVFFDLTEQVATGAFATPVMGTDNGFAVEYGQATSHLTAKCFVVNIDMLKIPVGATASCPGSFRFRAADTQWYRLSFQPDNYPGVDRFNVTCDAADATGCKLWTITPGGSTLTGGDPNVTSVTKLLLIDSAGTVIKEGGDYHLSFAITVAR